MLEQFLADAPQAVAIEDGELLFEFATAKYSVSGEGKCILHLWSEERNAVRRVLDAELKGQHPAPERAALWAGAAEALEICADPDRRKGAAKHAARTQYQRLLERVLLREYPGMKVEHLSSSPDLEHSFSPVYTARRAAGRSVGVCRARRQCRGDAVVGGCGAHLRHSLDGLPAAAACRTSSRGRAEAVSAAGTSGNRAPARGPSPSRGGQVAALRTRRTLRDLRASRCCRYRQHRHAPDPRGGCGGRTRALRCVHCAHSCAGACGGDYGRVRLGNRLSALRPGICPRPPDSGFRIVPQCRNDFLRHRLGGVCARRKHRSAVPRTGAGHPRAAPTRRLAYQPVLPSGP